MAQDNSQELAALKKVKNFALIQLIASIVMIAVVVILVFSLLFSAVNGMASTFNKNYYVNNSAPFTSSPNQLPTSMPRQSLTLFVPIIYLIAGVFAITALYVLRSGFKLFTQKNKAYHTPTLLLTCSIPIQIIGLVLLVVSSFLFFGSALSSTTSPVRSILGFGWFFGSLIIFIVGSTISLVGALWGIWEVGSIYHNDLVKAGAILTTFINIPILGPLLLYFGIGEITNNLLASKPRSKR